MASATVFSQVIQLIPRSEFQGWVTEHDADRGVRRLDSWTWFGAMLFGQLTGHDSIRAIERVFAQSDAKMSAMGFGPVRRSTLADANQLRSLAVLEEAFRYCLARAAQFAPKANGFRFHGDVFALDSTTIELCLSLCPWARFHHGKGAVKLHELREIAAMDRGYVDYAWMNDLNVGGVTFVTRSKSNCRFKVVESRKTNRTQGYMADQTIRLSSLRGKEYEGLLRRVSYRDPDTGRWLVFLTNNFELSYRTICALYKARWKVELFFKTLKQNLRIKKFLGTSVNAVKSQILVALIAYLLVQILRFSAKTPISIPDAMAVIGTLLLLREPISRLLGDLPRITRHPPSPQMGFKFA